MGYDMTMRAPSVAELVEKGERRTVAYVIRRDDPTYFRLNISGMGAMREVMEQAGAGTWEGEASWPEYPGSEHFNRHGDPVDEVGLAYEAQVKALRMARTTTLVPLHKFCSNDGWVVTPGECRLIAERVRSLLESDDYDFGEDGWREMVRDWADYCADAANFADGFEVW